MQASCTNSFWAQTFRTALNMATQLPVCPLPALAARKRFATDTTARLSYKQQVTFAATTPNRLCSISEGLQPHPAPDDSHKTVSFAKTPHGHKSGPRNN